MHCESHVSPAGQANPQAPQFCGSELKEATQAPAQQYPLTSGGPRPNGHSCPPSGSTRRHSANGTSAGHVRNAHSPSTHALWVSQVVPHVPQFSGSLARSTHWLKQQMPAPASARVQPDPSGQLLSGTPLDEVPVEVVVDVAPLEVPPEAPELAAALVLAAEELLTAGDVLPEVEVELPLADAAAEPDEDLGVEAGQAASNNSRAAGRIIRTPGNDAESAT
jgi:hypothetical protein